MLLPALALVFGLGLLLWSADRFVEGAAGTAAHFGMPPLLIGMVVIGFGTSAPEMIVSAIAALEGSPAVALGNAFGSNIANIALILGATALISPIVVHSQVLRKELPILSLVTVFAAALLMDGALGRGDALLLLAVFAGLMGWTIVQGLRLRADSLSGEMERELAGCEKSVSRCLLWLGVGLVLLVVSSRMLVWGAVAIARGLGVSDLVIGLTIVAVGTSLPELASSVAAARKGEHDLALGNVLGSNLFNTLAVVGIAGVIEPAAVDGAVLWRDLPVLGVLTVSLFALGFGFTGRRGQINRLEGSALLACYAAYLLWLMMSAGPGTA